MTTELISFENISKRFKDKSVLKNINFSINQGELYGFIGPSGAGKTTLFKIILGIYKPTKGKIIFKGKDLTGNIEEIKKQIGYSTQENSFYEKLTVQENLEHYGSLFNVPKQQLKQTIPVLLDLVHLTQAKDTIAYKLSGGMQRRLDLICSIIHNPEILVLDEPTAGLDPVLRKEMWHFIQRIHKTGKTILISSHALGEIDPICTRISILNEGTILATGTPQQLKDEYSKNQEIHLETFPGNYEKIIPLIDRNLVTYIKNLDHKLLIYTKDSNLFLKKVIPILAKAGESIRTLDVNQPTLDEVFEALTTENTSVTEKYKNYIQEARSKGYSEDQIKTALLKQDIPLERVERLLRA